MAFTLSDRKNYALATAWGLFFDSFSYEEFSRKQMNDEMTELARIIQMEKSFQKNLWKTIVMPFSECM